MVRASAKLLPFEFRGQPSPAVDEGSEFGEEEVRTEDEVGRLAVGQAVGEAAPIDLGGQPRAAVDKDV